MEDLIPRNHVSLKSSDIVRALASNLFKSTGLNYFFYERIYNQNSFFFLNTDLHFFSRWFNIKLNDKTPLLSESITDGVYLWSNTENKQFLQVMHALNYSNGITIIKNHDSYLEAFGFAAPIAHQHIMSLYLNKMELLNKFVLYFKDQASQLIAKARQQLIILPDYMKHPNQDKENSILYNELTNSMAIKKYNFNDKYNDINLSKRELQCLSLYLKRNTTTQIAHVLNLQKSAVDNYIYRVKKKFHCNSSSDLINLFWDLGILKSNGWFDIQ
jgi:DNA-binding CsgD family transcriptional regulator